MSAPQASPFHERGECIGVNGEITTTSSHLGRKATGAWSTQLFIRTEESFGKQLYKKKDDGVLGSFL